MVDGIDHLERPVRGVIALFIGCGHVGGEELRAHPALLHARQIGLVIGVGLTDIEAGDGGAGDVVMGVDEQGRPVHAHHFGIGDGALLAAGELREDGGGGHDEGDCGANGHCGGEYNMRRPVSRVARGVSGADSTFGGTNPIAGGSGSCGWS